jgi:hypothetical protein
MKEINRTSALSYKEGKKTLNFAQKSYNPRISRKRGEMPDSTRETSRRVNFPR